MAHSLRIITRLDIKNPNLIKSVQLEGVKVVGDPIKFAEKYYIDGADEIIYMDAVASLYNRNSVFDIINKTAENIWNIGNLETYEFEKFWKYGILKF